MASPRQGTLPFQRRSAGQTQHPPESVVQSHIVYHLRSRGYTVLVTSEHRKREPCPKCQAMIVSSAGRGCDKGVPDLLVSRETWPEAVWAGLEVKGHKTPLSAEQKYLKEGGFIFIVRSPAEALSAIARVEAAIVHAQ